MKINLIVKASSLCLKQNYTRCFARLPTISNTISLLFPNHLWNLPLYTLIIPWHHSKTFTQGNTQILSTGNSADMAFTFAKITDYINWQDPPLVKPKPNLIFYLPPKSLIKFFIIPSSKICSEIHFKASHITEVILRPWRIYSEDYFLSFTKWSYTCCSSWRRLVLLTPCSANIKTDNNVLFSPWLQVPLISAHALWFAIVPPLLNTSVMPNT